MNLKFSVRSKNSDNTDYAAPESQGLSIAFNRRDGDGSKNKPFRIRIQVKNTNLSAWSGIVHCEMEFFKERPRFFLPGFMYGSNRGEAPLYVANEFPRLRNKMERPASPWWMTRSDRLSHPIAMAFDTGRMYGLMAAPYLIRQNQKVVGWKPGLEGEFYQYSGFTCSLERGSIGYTLGYENAPWLYIQSHKVKERAPLGDNCFTLAGGEVFTFEITSYDFPAADERMIYQVVEHAYQEYHQSPREGSDIPAAVSDLASAISRFAWLEEEHAYSGFVFEEPDGSFSYRKIFSISWTNGLSVAVPVLISALRLENSEMRRQALQCIDHIVANSLNPDSGLPYETWEGTKWSNQGWWFDGMHTPGHTAYLTGQTMYYLLKAYEYEKKLYGEKHGAWLDFVEKLSLKVEITKNTDDEYPYIFSERTGAGIEYDAFAGTWILAAQAYWCWISGDISLIGGLKKSEAHYYENYIKRAECYGAPLDTDKTIDSEGILAYIRAVRWLHTITDEDIYLQHMRDALSYEFTFKFCYNSPVKVPPLSRLKWSSCGGSITSVANPHIHPMSCTITDEMLYYIKHKPDAYIVSRLKDTIGWGLQTYNRFDKEYDYGFCGWMSERFCHCEGLVVQEYPDSSLASTWFALMPWAGGSVLEGINGDVWDSL